MEGREGKGEGGGMRQIETEREQKERARINKLLLYVVHIKENYSIPHF